MNGAKMDLRPPVHRSWRRVEGKDETWEEPLVTNDAIMMYSPLLPQ